jgi:hypothetical protein
MERGPCILGFTILKPWKEVLVSLGLLYCSHGKRSLYRCVYYTVTTERGLVYPLVYYTEATERGPCILAFTVLKSRKEVLVPLRLLYCNHGKRSRVSFALLYCSHGKRSLYPCVYCTVTMERGPCILAFTVLKPRKEVLVPLRLLYCNHGKRSRVSFGLLYCSHGKRSVYPCVYCT